MKPGDNHNNEVMIIMIILGKPWDNLRLVIISGVDGENPIASPRVPSLCLVAQVQLPHFIKKINFNGFLFIARPGLQSSLHYHIFVSLVMRCHLMSEEDDDDDNNNWLMARYDYIIQKEERVDTQGHISGKIPDLEFEKHKNVKKIFCDA